MFAGKKGEALTHWTIIQLTLLALIGTSFFIFVARVKDDTSFQKTYLATDLAFLIEKLQTSPGNVALIYTLGKVPLEDYTFSFKDALIRVADKKQRMLAAQSPFMQTPDITLRLPEQNNITALYFAKNQESLQLVAASDFIRLRDDPCIAILQDTGTLLSGDQQTLVLISDNPEAHLLSSQIATTISGDLFQNKKIITVKDAISYDRSQLSLDDDLVLSLHVRSGEQDQVIINYGLTAQKQQAAALGCYFVDAFRKHGFSVAAPQQSSSAFLQENLNGIALGFDVALFDQSAYKNPSLFAVLIRDVLSSATIEHDGVPQ